MCGKTSLCSSTPWVSPNYCCWQGPSRIPLLYVPTQRLRLLLLFHLVFPRNLGSLSIKERIQWVGTHEKLKCVITYSSFEPLPSLRVICFLTPPGDRGALCIAFINLHPTQTSLLREVIKIIRLLSENISLSIITPRIMRVERNGEISDGWEREGQ